MYIYPLHFKDVCEFPKHDDWNQCDEKVSAI
jgi:hypothetical protein